MRSHIAWDNDPASNERAMTLAEKLMAQGIKCIRVVFPTATKDANEFAMKVKDGNGAAHGSLGMLLRSGEWLMPQDIDVTKRYVPKHEAPASEVREGETPVEPSDAQPMQPAPKEEKTSLPVSEPITIPTHAIVDEPTKLLLLGAKTLEALAPMEPSQTTVPVKVPAASCEAQIKDNEIIIPIGNRSYRIRGLARNSNGFDSMKVNVLAPMDLGQRGWELPAGRVLQSVSHASEVQAANERGTANERVAQDVAVNLGQSHRKPGGSR